MTEEKAKITIVYDRANYSEDQITEIEGELSRYFAVRKTTLVRKSALPPSIFVLILLSAPLAYFCKGFFTKIGESLGEEVGGDLREGYQRIKEKIGKIITRPISKDIPTLIFQIPILENQQPIYDRGIKGVIKTNDEELLSECFDHVKELYHIARKTIDQIGSPNDVIQITFDYNIQDKSWEPRWCTKEGPTILLYKDGKWEPID